MDFFLMRNYRTIKSATRTVIVFFFYISRMSCLTDPITVNVWKMSNIFTCAHIKRIYG